MTKRRKWSREETIVALYILKNYDSRHFNQNSEVILRFSKKIKRAPSALVMKILNLQSAEYRGSKGLKNYSKLDKKIMEEYQLNPDSFALVFDRISSGVVGNNRFKYIIVNKSVKEIKNRKFLSEKYYQSIQSRIIPLFVISVNSDQNTGFLTALYSNSRLIKEGVSIKNQDVNHYLDNQFLKLSPFILQYGNYISIDNNDFSIDAKDYDRDLFKKPIIHDGLYPELDKKMKHYFEVIISQEELLYDTLYQDEINTSEVATDEEVKQAYKQTLEFVQVKSGSKVKRNPRLAKAAIQKVSHICEFDKNHRTFTNKEGQHYMEGHHLIPLTNENASYFFNVYGINIDCVQNIVSLCPTCHKAIHLGDKNTRKKIIKQLYKKKIKALENVGINISLDELYELYRTK